MKTYHQPGLVSIALPAFNVEQINQYTEKWLARAQELCPADRRGAYQMSLYRFNPWLYRMKIYLRYFLHLKLS